MSKCCKRYSSFFRFFAVIMICIVLLQYSVSAAENPYSSYQSWKDQNSTEFVKQPAVFLPDGSYDGVKFGEKVLSNPQDLCVSGNAVYILDSGNERIVVLNSDYTFKSAIDHFTYQGDKISIQNATGIYVDSDSTIYICDPEAKCVLISDTSGKIRTVLTCPDSAVIPDELDFVPRKIVSDKDGYLFVLCEGVYYGAMVFNADLEFCCFFGASNTKTSILGAIKSFFTDLFQTDKKLEYSVRTLPYTFENLCEHNGFIYTTTVSSETESGQIRKLSYSGQNVLKNNGESGDSFVFGNGQSVKLIDNTMVKEAFSAVEVDDNGYIYALDSTYGRVLVYNDNCDMITAFGGGLGMGTQVGVFKTAVELETNGSDVLVLDSTQNSLTVFKTTDYGKILFQAMSCEKSGDYEASFPLWTEVHKLDAYNQMAYVGISNYYLHIKEYSKAMEYAKKGANRDIYERAFEEVRLSFLSEKFGLIFLIVLFVAGLIVFSAIWRKKHPTEKKDSDFRFLVSCIFHPIRSYLFLKQMRVTSGKRQIRLGIIAFGLMVLMFIASVLKTTLGGFMYVSYDPNTYNSLLVLITTVGIALLWCIVNWGLCTLFEGKGNFKEIVIVTGFSLVPLIINDIFYIISTHILVYSESTVIGMIGTLSWIITILLILVGMSVIHEYSFFKSIGMSIATLAGMFVVAFIIFLVITLFQDVFEFVKMLYFEAVYRG